MGTNFQCGDQCRVLINYFKSWFFNNMVLLFLLNELP